MCLWDCLAVLVSAGVLGCGPGTAACCVASECRDVQTVFTAVPQGSLEDGGCDQKDGVERHRAEHQGSVRLSCSCAGGPGAERQGQGCGSLSAADAAAASDRELGPERSDGSLACTVRPGRAVGAKLSSDSFGASGPHCLSWRLCCPVEAPVDVRPPWTVDLGRQRLLLCLRDSG
ncbi:hypothetical protein J1605_006416 [Eschrichtius robustus]|uniref:Secreted protein n=1 Tax=Eschrichtius robustus TaxID=9764 RepID=A0AB34H3H5_ESCRO|nr:hypothetical protein J1605_006416 [Eschrichtius robustus]